MQEKLKIDELLQKLERLSRENERLKSILSAHGINYEQNPSPKDEEVLAVRSNADSQGLLSKEQILQQRKDLFRSLFKGREDVFALRWTMVASPVTCRHAPTVGLLFVIEKNTNAPTVRTANLLL